MKYFFLIFLISSTIFAEELKISPTQTIKLWPNTTLPETPRKYAKRSGNVTRIYKVLCPALEWYPAPGREKHNPAIIICPGGGYNILAYDKEGTEIAQWLNSIGFTALVLRYTVPGKKDQAFKDAQRAMSLIRFHAQEWNIDSNRVGILGFSAGGHLAARLCTNWQTRSYKKIDAADQTECRPDFTILIYPAYLSPKTRIMLPRKSIPVNKKTPPAFIVQTLDDTHINGALAYFQALKNAGVEAEIHLYPKGGHGYGMRTSNNPVSQWPELCKSWLAQWREK